MRLETDQLSVSVFLFRIYLRVMNVLVGQNLGKRFGDRDILGGVIIKTPKGASIAIAGATGSGKSTLLKILSGLVDPDEGAVLFNGQKIEGPLTKLILGHEKIAYLSQYFELRKQLPCRRNF